MKLEMAARRDSERLLLGQDTDVRENGPGTKAFLRESQKDPSWALTCGTLFTIIYSDSTCLRARISWLMLMTLAATVIVPDKYLAELKLNQVMRHVKE
ncbi:hypothetical protein KM043_015797 [Ampulex compressa]|nr:hypothetical protein KM043_015797 [Ampulex compressa]